MVLVSDTDFGSALSEACEHNADSDPIQLAELLTYVVRKDILKIKNQFNGSFEKERQKELVPVSFIAIVAIWYVLYNK